MVTIYFVHLYEYEVKSIVRHLGNNAKFQREGPSKT